MMGKSNAIFRFHQGCTEISMRPVPVFISADSNISSTDITFIQ